MTRAIIDKGSGELLVGTRKEIERDIAELVRSAGAARGVLSFTEPAPWPDMPGLFYVRARVVRAAERAAPPARRRTVAYMIAVAVTLVLGVAGAGAWYVYQHREAIAEGLYRVALILGVLALLSFLLGGGRKCVTVVKITHHH